MSRARILWWVVSALYAAAIFALSAQPGNAVGLPAPWDKVAHLCAYAGLAFALRQASGRTLLSVLLASAYGVTDELHQSTVPGRLAGADDWLADTVGAALGAWLGQRYGLWRGRGERESVRRRMRERTRG